MTEQADIKQKFCAVILAGDRGAEDPVARAAGLSRKCLVPVAGVPMLERVVAALAASPWIGDIAVVIEEPELLQGLEGLRPHLYSGRLRALPAAASPSQSVLQAGAALAAEFPLLITTADHALLNPDMIASFCGRSQALAVDIAVGLTAASLLQARFPQSRRTYLAFRGERYSGSNLFALMTRDGLKAAEFWRRAEQNRKQPWRLAGTFGPWLLVAYLLRLYSLEQAMRKISRRLAFRVAAVELPFAEAAIDVDKPADLALVEEILKIG